MHTLLRRARLRALLPLLLLATAGGGTTAAAPASPLHSHSGARASKLTVAIASSDLAVGVNRFTFGILDNNHPVEGNERPSLAFYYVHGNSSTLVQRTVAFFNHFARGLKDTDANSAAVEIGGVYVTYARFTHPGNWGVVITTKYKGKTVHLTPGFSVTAHSLSPAVGSPVPRSNNPTIHQMPASKLDSGQPPDDMHGLSIAGAIGMHKPLVVLFATAAFCTSRMCGPEIEVVQGLERQFRKRGVNFVHIEVYKNADPQYGYAPAVSQWHLKTEPWVFVVGRTGRVVAKFEGPTPATEIAPAIRRAMR